jgi:hypothetical protein
VLFTAPLLITLRRHVAPYIRCQCPRLPPKTRWRRRAVIPLWRASGAPLWVLLLVLKIFNSVDAAVAQDARRAEGAPSMVQRLLLDLGGLAFGIAAMIDLVRWWRT